MEKPHAIIVGGGVIGLSLAWEMLGRGHRVTLLERDKVGRAASWAAAGILPPARFGVTSDPLDQLRGLSHELFPKWTETITRETGIDTGFRRCGGWYLAETNGERAAMIGMEAFWSDLEIVCERQSLDELRHSEPALTDWTREHPDGAAWWVPGECQVSTPDLLAALAAACRARGAEIIEGIDVTDLREGSGCGEVRIADRWIAGDSVTLCGGAWVGGIATKLRLEKSVVPVRGQIVSLRSPESLHSPSPLLSSIINIGNRYLVCRESGNVLVGSVEEEVGFRPGTTPEVLNELEQFAHRVCPPLQQADVEDSWSGFRPMTFDGFPMIGGVPNHPHVYVAAGHFRSGIHLAFATAVVLADAIGGRQPPIDLHPFRVGKQQQQTG